MEINWTFWIAVLIPLGGIAWAFYYSFKIQGED